MHLPVLPGRRPSMPYPDQEGGPEYAQVVGDKDVARPMGRERYPGEPAENEEGGADDRYCDARRPCALPGSEDCQETESGGTSEGE